MPSFYHRTTEVIDGEERSVMLYEPPPGFEWAHEGEGATFDTQGNPLELESLHWKDLYVYFRDHSEIQGIVFVRNPEDPESPRCMLLRGEFSRPYDKPLPDWW